MGLGDNSQVTQNTIRINADGGVHHRRDVALHIDTAGSNFVSTHSYAG